MFLFNSIYQTTLIAAAIAATVIYPVDSSKDYKVIILPQVKVLMDFNSPPYAALEDTTLIMADPIYEMNWNFEEKNKGSQKSIELIGAGTTVKYSQLTSIAKEYKTHNQGTRGKAKKPLWISRAIESNKKEKVVSNNFFPSTLKEEVGNRNTDLPVGAISRGMRVRVEKLGGIESLLGEEKKIVTANSLAKKLVEEELEKQALVKAKPILEKVFLTGKVEVADGLAYMGGDDYIVVYREDDNELKESGIVWIKNGKYEVFVEEVKGTLVSELRNSEGVILGETNIDLSDITSLKIQKNKVLGLNLKVVPLADGLTGKVSSIYGSKGKEFLVDDAKVQTSFENNLRPLQKGKFLVDDLSVNSSFQLRSQASSHWGTILVGQNNQSYNVKLFPNKMIDALYSLVADDVFEKSEGSVIHSKESNAPVIWGKVMASEKTLAGVVVSIASEEVMPVYFNSLMIPDLRLTATSKNGLFAFVGISNGVHQVKASVGGKEISSKIVSSQEKHVSYVKMEKVRSHIVPVTVFDAMETDYSIPAVLKVVGQGNTRYEAGENGLGIINLPKDKSLMFLEATPFNDYPSVRLTKSKNSKSIQVPMVSEDWINKLFKQAKISRDYNKSLLIGYINFENDNLSGDPGVVDDLYKVELGSDAKDFNYKKIFFNNVGEWSGKSVNGGGFILSDLEKGLQTIVITPQNTFKKYSEVFVADPSVLSVVQKNYR